VPVDSAVGGGECLDSAGQFSGGACTNPGWSLAGNEEDPGAWTAWLTGPTGNGTGAARTLFQDTMVKNYLARDPNANSLTYVWDSAPAAIYGMAELNEASRSPRWRVLLTNATGRVGNIHR
jgi:hypothetical protein